MLFEEDDHSLRTNSLEAKVMLCSFVENGIGVEIEDGEQEEIPRKALVAGKQKENLMKKGTDFGRRGASRVICRLYTCLARREFRLKEAEPRNAVEAEAIWRGALWLGKTIGMENRAL